MAIQELPPAGVLAFGPAGAGGAVVGGRGLLRGYAVENTDAALVARVLLLDGATAAGQLMVPIRLAANESTRDFWPGAGLLFEGGVFANVTDGAVNGVAYVTLEDALPPGMWDAILTSSEWRGAGA